MVKFKAHLEHPTHQRSTLEVSRRKNRVTQMPSQGGIRVKNKTTTTCLSITTSTKATTTKRPSTTAVQTKTTTKAARPFACTL